MNDMITIREDGIIHVRYKETMDMDTINQYISDYAELLLSSPPPRRVLVDLTKMVTINSQERRRLGEGVYPLKEHIYKIAMVGVNSPFKEMALNIVNAIFRRDDIRLFRTIDEAVRWLSS